MVGFTELAPLLLRWLGPVLVLFTVLSTFGAMAPKGRKKADGDEGGKPKRQKRTAQGGRARHGEGIDKNSLDQMRSWLARHAKQKDEAGTASAAAIAAQAAQNLWNEMKDLDDRKRFLQTFQQDSGKTLQWVASFRETCTNSEEHAKKARKGYCNVSQALALKNLRLADFATRAEAMDFVHEWWEENAAEFGTKEAFPVREDAKKRDLFKQWYFVHKDLDEDRLVTKDERIFQGHSNLNNSQALEMATKAMSELPSSSPQGPVDQSTGAVQVKIENPQWPLIQEKKVLIESRPRQPLPGDPSQRGPLSQASPPHPLLEGEREHRACKQKSRNGKKQENDKHATRKTIKQKNANACKDRETFWSGSGNQSMENSSDPPTNQSITQSVR